MSLEPDILTCYADGECSPEQAARVEAALRDSPQARAAYAQLRQHRSIARCGPPAAGQDAILLVASLFLVWLVIFSPIISQALSGEARKKRAPP